MNYRKSILPLLCPNCNNYPLLTFKENKPKQIFIQCKLCEYFQFTEMSKYLSYLQSNSQQTNENNTFCKEHKSLPNNFCEKCNLHLCGQCEHSKRHHLINISSTISTNKIKNRIEDGYKYINNDCLQIKIYTQRKLFHQINQIEFAYQSFQTRNNNILSLLEIMIDNYQNNPNNYYLKYNIRNIPEINISNLVNNDTTESIINYYNNYTIIKTMDVDFSYFQSNKVIDKYKDISSLLVLSDGRIIVSDKQSIKVYNPSINYQSEIEINSEHSIVSQLDNGKLLSYLDTSISIWNITESSLQCEHTIEKAHKDEILYVIELSNNRIASCSSNKKIKIWNSVSPYSYIESLHSITDYTNFLLQKKGQEILYSTSSCCNYLQVWNILTYQLEACIGMKGPISNMIEIDNNQALLTTDCEILLINLSSYKIIQNLVNDKLNKQINLSYLRNGYFLCTTSMGIVCVYDSILNIIKFKSTCLHKEFYCKIKTVSEKTFISYSNREIKIWNY